MIKYLKVEGLNGNKMSLEFHFNDDLNLFTGLNGCGKTTILKILWFVNSGHFVHLVNEIVFQSLTLKTNNYKISITRSEKGAEVLFNTGKGDRKGFIPLSDGIQRRVSNDVSIDLYEKSDESVFFPTFRRIEGGFLIENSIYRRTPFPMKNALSDLSNELSTSKHKFVSYVSTEDITLLVNREYSTVMREINELQENKFGAIRERIKDKKGKKSDFILQEIESDITDVENKSAEKLLPFSTLKNLILSIFNKKGIEMDAIVFGDFENAISSEKLSAGEKQMLSFLCYNTFSKNKIIFIDEPELSLHPDWQRLLVPTLLKQGNNNQFFIATHSPFIYTKYADKEIVLSEDKGGM
ncbi:AAA ATPase domain-containing protein [Bacteroidales bacterium KHT7]|nr:AAA ATPase domain-containing protein [Bacteroidales bacterium KHT7]